MDMLSHMIIMIQVSLESSRNKDSTPKLIEQSGQDRFEALLKRHEQQLEVQSPTIWDINWGSTNRIDQQKIRFHDGIKPTGLFCWGGIGKRSRKYGNIWDNLQMDDLDTPIFRYVRGLEPSNLWRKLYNQ